MTLIVEDGTGLSTAQTVASSADLSAYLTARGQQVPTTGQMEAALVNGWSYIETSYRGRWQGVKMKPQDPSLGGQALAWPRVGVRDEEGFVLTPRTIPTLLKNANCEAARLSLGGTDLSNAATKNNASVIHSLLRAGDHQEEYEYATAVSLRGQDLKAIDLMLGVYLMSVPGETWGTIRLVRG